MSNKPPNQHSLTLRQHNLHLIIAAYHELDYIRYTETGDMMSEIKAFEQFAQELVRAISDDPEIDPLDVLSVAFGTDRNSLEVAVDAQIIRQFVDACLSMEDQFAARVFSEPFDEVVTERALGGLEF